MTAKQRAEALIDELNYIACNYDVELGLPIGDKSSDTYNLMMDVVLDAFEQHREKT